MSEQFLDHILCSAVHAIICITQVFNLSIDTAANGVPVSNVLFKNIQNILRQTEQ